jgi:prepilin-type processing-associated H-X9-DG protein
MTKLRRAPFVCLSLLIAVGLAQVAPAAGSAVDELTKVLPDNVVYFVATGGGAALDGDFQKSVLGRLWNDPGTQSFVGSIRTELMTMLNKEADEDEEAAMVAMALEYAQLALDRPLVVGVAGVEAEEGPPACVFAILDAGDRKSELAAALTKAEAMIGEEEEIAEIEVGSLKMHGLKDNDEVPLYWGWVGNHLVFAVNDAKGAVAKHVLAPRAAATDHLQKIPGKGDLVAVYYDVHKIWSIVDAFAASEGEEEDLAPVKAVFKQVGLSDVGAVVGRVGFSGTDLVSDSFVEAPAPRTGLLAAFKPVDLTLLGTVDAQAVTASAFNCDIAGIYDMVMNAIKTASPDEAYPEIQKGLAEVESELGFRIREGLLKSLAGSVVFYSLPAGKMVEAPMGGVVVGLKLNDPALFEKTMTSIGAFATQMSEGMLQVGSQAGDDGQTMHVWASPMLAVAQVMPTWSIVGDQVIIGSNTALCKMGLKQAASQDVSKSSLLQTEGFKQVAKALPQGLLSVTYTDSQVMFNQMLMQAQQFWPMAAMAAMQADIKLPVMLPSLGHIAKDMKPSCEYSYADAAGFHSHYQGSGLEVSLRGIAGTAFAAGLAMPALARARVQGRRAVSMSNLKQLGLAVHMYADEHDDKLPPDLESAKAYYGSDQVLQSPHKPKDFDGPSYIYIPGQTLAMYPGNFVAYENPAFCAEGVNVLHLDGHVEFMKPEMFREELKGTYERLGRIMPEIRFLGD